MLLEDLQEVLKVLNQLLQQIMTMIKIFMKMMMMTMERHLVLVITSILKAQQRSRNQRIIQTNSLDQLSNDSKINKQRLKILQILDLVHIRELKVETDKLVQT